MDKLKESDLALKFIEHFKNCGYEVYKEVEYLGGRIDIVATDGKIHIACEVKTSANLQVLYQAIRAHEWCHYSYVAIPKVTDSFYIQICDKYNIGVLETTKWGNVWERSHPILHRNIRTLKLQDFQKESIAGAPSGGQMTNFKITIREIVNYVNKHPGAKLSDVLNNVVTHYHTVSTAKSSIRQWVNKGIIKEFTIEKGIVILSPIHPVTDSPIHSSSSSSSSSPIPSSSRPPAYPPLGNDCNAQS